LYTNTIQQLTNFSFSLLGDDDLVKDVLQEVYSTLYVRRNELPDELNVVGYLTNAIKYQSAHHVRHQLVKNTYSNFIEFSSATETKIPDAHMEHRELNNRIGKSLASLPEKCRTAFVLHKLEQHPYKTVSEKMGISVKTVEKHISKALKQLRTELSDVRSIFPFL